MLSFYRYMQRTVYWFITKPKHKVYLRLIFPPDSHNFTDQKFHSTQVRVYTGITKSKISTYLFERENSHQAECIAQKRTTVDMLALVVLHFVVFVLILPKNKHVKLINEGIWLIKIFFIALFTVLAQLTFGPSVSYVFEFVSTILSSILYLLTNIIIVDNIYFLDFKFSEWSQKHKKLHIFKVILSIVFWILALVCHVFGYFENQLWVCISNSVLISIFLILAVLRISKANTFFVYTITIFHLMMLSFSIHPQSQPSNSFFRTIEHAYRILVMVIALLGMLAEGGNQVRTKTSTFNEMLALNTSKKQQDNRYVSSNKWIVYHFVMVLIALSFASVFTYSYHATSEGARVFFDVGRIVWWGSLIVIYLWTIFGGKIFPQQDFSQLENYFKEFQLN